jgi:hypothetical protein
MYYGEIAGAIKIHEQNLQDKSSANINQSKKFLEELKKAEVELKPYAEGKSLEKLQKIENAGEFTTKQDEEKIKNGLENGTKNMFFGGRNANSKLTGEVYNEQAHEWQAKIKIDGKIVTFSQAELSHILERNENKLKQEDALIKQTNDAGYTITGSPREDLTKNVAELRKILGDLQNPDDHKPEEKLKAPDSDIKPASLTPSRTSAMVSP